MRKTGYSMLGRCNPSKASGASTSLQVLAQQNANLRLFRATQSVGRSLQEPSSQQWSQTATAILALSGPAVSRMGISCDRCPSPEALRCCRVQGGSGHLLLCLLLHSPMAVIVMPRLHPYKACRVIPCIKEEQDVCPGAPHFMIPCAAYL